MTLPSTLALHPPPFVHPPASRRTFPRHRATRAAAAAERPATWNSGAACSTRSLGPSPIFSTLTRDWKWSAEWERRAPLGFPEEVPEVKTIAAASLGANRGAKEETCIATVRRRREEETRAKGNEEVEEVEEKSVSSSSSQTTKGASGPRGNP